MLGLIVAVYGAASLAAASGFLAVYVAAVILGNARLPHNPATRGFAEGIGWLSQIGLFVMLGLLASPSRLPAQLLPALVVGLVAVFLARPAAVGLSLLPLRLARRPATLGPRGRRAPPARPGPAWPLPRAGRDRARDWRGQAGARLRRGLARLGAGDGGPLAAGARPGASRCSCPGRGCAGRCRSC